MGGKSRSSNNAQLQFEMQQAEEAKQKEAERQARLTSGTTAINQLFDAGGFNDAFFNKYNQAQLDYTTPQLTDQYQRARDKLTYDLSRAGQLRSRVAGADLGQIEKEYATNQAGVTAAADQQTRALRDQIANNKQQAINQLYSTEDPTVAANSATGMVQQAAIATPNLQPLNAMFTPIAVGGVNALNSYLDANNIGGGLQPNPLSVNRGRLTQT
jgi:hypothetical protein